MTPLTIDNLTRRFGSVVAVDRMSLSVEPGELFFLLGPSGCGKTTLLRMLAGFVHPDEGRILFGDDDVTALPAHRRNCGMVFQNYALWPHMTVTENVAFGLKVRRVAAGERRSRVEKMLRIVRLEGYGDRRPAQLSGGQQQRVALARALAINPKLLLLDEPLSNLDAKLRIEMRSEIIRICRATGVTTIYVTHDQKEALSMADRLAVVNEGRIVQVGTPQEAYRRPGSRFVADFLGRTNFVEGTVASSGDGRAVLDCAGLGKLVGLTNGQSPAVGAKVTCSLRPEAVRLLGKDEQPDENAFDARLLETIYLGELAQHHLAVGGLEMESYEVNPRRVAGGSPTPVRCHVDPRDVVILPE